MATARLSANPSSPRDQLQTLDSDATVVGTTSEELRELARRPDLPPGAAAKPSAVDPSGAEDDAEKTAVYLPDSPRESATFPIPTASRGQLVEAVSIEGEDAEKTAVYRPEQHRDSATFPIPRETSNQVPEARVIIDQVALSLAVDDSITERLPRGPAYVEAPRPEERETGRLLVSASAEPVPAQGGFLVGFSLGILAGAVAALLALVSSAWI